MLRTAAARGESMEKIMAVYDVDREYANRFADVVNLKEKVPFTVVPFSSLELLREYAEKHRIEILLISDEVPQKEIRGIGARSVVTLAAGEVVSVSETEYPAVYKYQSADSVIREVMACYCDQPAEERFVALKKRARVLGVYSPVGRCFKTSMALILGHQLAREGKTVYVGFEEFSGLQRMIGGEYKNDLSDVLYFMRQNSLDVVRLRSLVYTWKNMDYIAPVRYPEDMELLSGDEAGQLVEILASECGYESVIVDVGRPGRNLLPILECCDVIYMPVKDDAVAAAKLEEFMDYLETVGQQRTKERIRSLKLPYHGNLRRGGDYLETLLLSDLGDYVRRLLKGAPGS